MNDSFLEDLELPPVESPSGYTLPHGNRNITRRRSQPSPLPISPEEDELNLLIAKQNSRQNPKQKIVLASSTVTKTYRRKSEDSARSSGKDAKDTEMLKSRMPERRSKLLENKLKPMENTANLEIAPLKMETKDCCRRTASTDKETTRRLDGLTKENRRPLEPSCKLGVPDKAIGQRSDGSTKDNRRPSDGSTKDNRRPSDGSTKDNRRPSDGSTKDNRRPSESSRRSGGSDKEIGQRSDSLTKENSRPSDSSRESVSQPEASREGRRNSVDGVSHRKNSTAQFETAMLNSVKEIVGTYTKNESVKILRAMQDLYVHSQANLIKLVLQQTDEIVNEVGPGKNSLRMRSLMEENARLKDTIAVLEARNAEFKKTLEESEQIRQENLKLKQQCEELSKSVDSKTSGSNGKLSEEKRRPGSRYLEMHFK